MATDTATTVRIPGRFNGPPTSANGGYACGYVAALLPSARAVAVRLHAPPPMDVDLPAEVDPGGAAVTVREVDGATVATARAAGPLDGLEPPVRPSVAEARAAMRGHLWLGREHMLSGCFVCGPHRHDGLGLHFGPLPSAPEVNGAVLIGDATLPHDDGGALDDVNVWGALDCPSYVPMLGRMESLALLGSLHAELLRPVPLGAPIVAVGWHESSDGRKHHTASALLTPDGDVLARARATWITLRD